MLFVTIWALIVAFQFLGPTRFNLDLKLTHNSSFVKLVKIESQILTGISIWIKIEQKTFTLKFGAIKRNHLLLLRTKKNSCLFYFVIFFTNSCHLNTYALLSHFMEILRIKRILVTLCCLKDFLHISNLGFFKIEHILLV